MREARQFGQKITPVESLFAQSRCGSEKQDCKDSLNPISRRHRMSFGGWRRQNSQQREDRKKGHCQKVEDDYEDAPTEEVICTDWPQSKCAEARFCS